MGAGDSAGAGRPVLPEGRRRFADRHDAGRRLARLLEPLRPEHPVVFGIPRGGVPVAAEVASAMRAPLDVVVVRKIGAPTNPEYGIGALAEGGARAIGEEVVRALGIGPEELQRRIVRAEGELAQARSRLPARPPLPVQGRTAIVVDDGLATGHTAQAAARALRERGAARVILAVPVAAPRSVAELGGDVDEVVCVEAPRDLWAIGLWYEDFAPTSDEEVAALLDEAAARSGAAAPRPPDDLSKREVDVLRLIALGHTNAEIAKQLFLSVRTVETHRAHIQRKLRLSSRAELVRYALERGLMNV